MRQPALRGRNETARNLGAAALRQLAGYVPRLSVPWEVDGPLRELLVRRDIEKGRQQRLGADLVCIRELRNRCKPDRRLIRDLCPGERAVRGPEVNADAV